MRLRHFSQLQCGMADQASKKAKTGRRTGTNAPVPLGTEQDIAERIRREEQKQRDEAASSSSSDAVVVSVRDDDDDDDGDDVGEMMYWYSERVTVDDSRKAMSEKHMSANKPFDVKQVQAQVQQILADSKGNTKRELTDEELSLQLLTLMEKFPHKRPVEIVELLESRRHQYAERVQREEQIMKQVAPVSGVKGSRGLRLDKRPIASYVDEYVKLKDFTRKQADLKPHGFVPPEDLPFHVEPTQGGQPNTVHQVMDMAQLPRDMSLGVKRGATLSLEENASFAQFHHLWSTDDVDLDEPNLESVKQLRRRLRRHRNITLYDVQPDLVLMWQKALLKTIREKCIKVYEKVFDKEGEVAYYITHIVPLERTSANGTLRVVKRFHPGNGVAFEWGGIHGSAISGLYHFFNDRKARALAGSHLCHRGTHSPVVVYEDINHQFYRWRVPCINPAHLTAESNVKNTSRNGCPGMLRGCMHRPMCIAPSDEADSKGWYFRFGFEA